MNPYEILNVPENASKDEIKKAYKAMAMKLHPDKGGDVAAFKRLNEAYRTLIKPPTTSSSIAHSKRAELVGAIVNEGTDGDVIQRARMLLHKATVLNDQNINAAVGKLEEAHRDLDRVTTTDEFNVFKGVMIEKVKGLGQQVQMLKTECETLKKVEKLLDTYVDSSPVSRFPRASHDWR